jgi:hypothetical protein
MGKQLERTLYINLEIDFNRWSKKIETWVLRGLHSTLTIFKRAGWICDYKMKGGEIE